MGEIMFISVFKDYCNMKEKPIILLVCFIIFSLLLTYFLTSIPEKFVNTLIASFSIFTALLFNLILLLIDMLKNTSSNIDITSRKDLQEIKLGVIDKCLKIISASIMFSITDIILLLFISFDYSNVLNIINNNLIVILVKYSLYFSTYFFILLFFDSLYSILKIMNILISKEVENKKKEFTKD